MATQYKIEEDGSITLTINMKPVGTFLQQEEQIAEAVLEVGHLASRLSLERHDTDGRPIVVENKRHTSRGQEKKYQTPWGCVEVNRHTYQSSSGGKLVIPLEELYCMIGGFSTPRFAKMVSWKYTRLPAGAVEENFKHNHGRPTRRCMIH